MMTYDNRYRVVATSTGVPNGLNFRAGAVVDPDGIVGVEVDLDMQATRRRDRDTSLLPLRTRRPPTGAASPGQGLWPNKHPIRSFIERAVCRRCSPFQVGTGRNYINSSSRPVLTSVLADSSGFPSDSVRLARPGQANGYLPLRSALLSRLPAVRARGTGSVTPVGGEHGRAKL